MTDKSQLEKFKELAREAECDPSEKKFDEALKKVSENKPSGGTLKNLEKQEDR